MIFAGLKSPFKIEPKISDGFKMVDDDFLSDKKMNEICIQEIIAPKEAIVSYLALLESEEFSRIEDYQKIIFHLAACYERVGELGKALYYMALGPYYYPGEVYKKQEDRLKTYKAILLYKAFEKFKHNKNKIQVLLVEPQMERLNFIISTIETACFQKVYAIDSKKRFDDIKGTAIIQEYELVLLSSELYLNTDELIKDYCGLKQWVYSSFVSFMLAESAVKNFRINCPGIRYYIVHDDLKFLYAILLMMLEKKV